jgi:predicted Zn-dependent peptidase
VNPFRDTGCLAIYAGTSADKTREVLTLTLAELSRMKQEIVPASELERAKSQLKSNMVIGLESSSSRMSSLARQQMYFGRFFPVDEIVALIERVTPDEIQALAQQLFRPESIALTLLGNLGTMKVERADLAC